MVRSFLGLRSPAVYTLEDVADDAAALLDHLEDRHGPHRRRVDGRHDRAGLRRPAPGAHQDAGGDLLEQQPAGAAAARPKQLLAILQRPKDATREAIIENAIRVSKIIGSPGYPAPEDRIRAEAIEGYDRSYYPAGVGRHFAAILGSGSLLHYDRQITAPTVVIHGKADKLMRPFGGRAVARAIKGARLVLFDGMGHELPATLWDDIVGELKTTFAASSCKRCEPAPPNWLA